MWILSSHVISISIIIIIISSACGACGVGSVFSPKMKIFVTTAVFSSWKKQFHFTSLFCDDTFERKKK